MFVFYLPIKVPWQFLEKNNPFIHRGVQLFKKIPLFIKNFFWIIDSDTAAVYQGRFNFSKLRKYLLSFSPCSYQRALLLIIPKKCLETVNFGPQIRQWIHVFYHNISSCVLNNSHASETIFPWKRCSTGVTGVSAIGFIVRSSHRVARATDKAL